MKDRADLQISRRETRDRSMVLWVIGALFVLPPVAGIFLLPGTIFGLPIPVLYIFAVWLFLIVGAAALAKPLDRMEYGSRGDSSSSGQN